MFSTTARFFPVLLAASSCAYAAMQDAGAVVSQRSEPTDKGTRVVQDVSLATATGGYTLRYEYLEREDDPARIGFSKWAPTLGYVPLGIAEPSLENWYNQGFFQWTFDGFNINEYKAQFRVIREFGPDAMVEYVWDTPKVKAIARFAVTSRSDKLLFFGRYEPREEIRDVRLRLMAYPATFEKPWNRRVTSQARTLAEGAADIDLAQERWLLFEDVEPGRTGAGPAGLLLGDASAFASVAVSGIGGYAEYTDLVLNPGRRDFALAFYEAPSRPEFETVRAYFRRIANAESDALAALATADWDQPLAPLPVDEERVTQVRAEDEASLNRPAELWRPNPEPLEFPWAADLPGEPVCAALLAPRWSAYDTMELARRLELNVRHQYFDSPNAITNPNLWHYKAQTGIGALNANLAMRNAVAICLEPERDVIVAAALKGDAIGPRLQQAILGQVRDGKGLIITGGADATAGWPQQLFAVEDTELVNTLLAYLPWDSMPSLRKGSRGRLSEAPPLRAYRCGEGRVLVFQANIAHYSALLPLNSLKQGLDGADDRLLALHGLFWAAAAGAPLPARIAFGESLAPIMAATASELPVDFSGAEFARALVRIQDDTDAVHILRDDLLDETGTCLRIPPLPAMHAYYLDIVALNGANECVGVGGTVLHVAPEYTLASLAVSPSQQNHETAPPLVDLPDGGPLTITAAVTPAPEPGTLRAEFEVRDCLGRTTARAEGPVAGDGRVEAAVNFPRPVVVPHRLVARLLAGEELLATAHLPFTAAAPYPYDDFTVLMWSYAEGDLTLRTENRLCYLLGSDMMDLCHMRGYTDAGAAREYAVAAESGQRIVPYVTRIAGDAGEDHLLKPSLFDAAWIERERASIEICCRQAAPYQPPAYTLGDENYLAHSSIEVDLSPENVAAFKVWLQQRYPGIEALNAVWKTSYTSFDAIAAPMLLDEARNQTASFAPWFDFRSFMDTAFADLHETFAGCVRREDPGAKVGWDGFLGYHWLAGYDFYKLSRNLELNQVYTAYPLQGELVRSFKRPGALTGEWGNAVADKEDGFSAILWHNLFRGHNSAWWWTSWGCDYIPFNPDMSVSNMGKWFFDSAAEVKAGPGRLLLHARRDDSGIAVLYNQADLFAARLLDAMPHETPLPDWQANLIGVVHALEDIGCQYAFIAAAELEADPGRLDGYRALVLPLATCISDDVAQTVRAFAQRGGVVIADGRPGLLTGNGGLREPRPLDELFGVQSPAGIEAFKAHPQPAALALAGEPVEAFVLETGLTLAGGATEYTVGETPCLVTHAFGNGHAVLLNVPFSTVTALRTEKRERTLLDPLARYLALAGVAPSAHLAVDGKPARCIEQTLFVDGKVRYLALQQDILVRGLEPQSLAIAMDTPAFVYDVRAGRSVAEAPVDRWDAVISRGNPQLFALMPYAVSGLAVTVAPECALGDTLDVAAAVAADGAQPQFHVVRVDVFAPGSERPHRQYSQNLACADGQGKGTIPFALNDPAGAWRLVFRDVATGTSAEAVVHLAAR